MARVTLPEFAALNRSLSTGMHRYVDVFPGAALSPALRRIAPDDTVRLALLDKARVSIAAGNGYAWIDIHTPCIVLCRGYYLHGTPLDLYLDMLHELTHLRQLDEGADLWDERFAYVDRITEIEGYAVAVEEGRRLGMNHSDIIGHLSNPWMTEEDVLRLVRHVDDFLAGRAPAVAMHGVA